MLLFSLKVRYPNRIYLLRGNHESRFLSRSYMRVLCITGRFGFYQQCLNYYGDDSVWNEFMKAFDCLPLCAVVNKHVFAVHAGISPKLQFIRDIDAIDRFQEIPVISFAHGVFIPSFPGRLVLRHPLVGPGKGEWLECVHARNQPNVRPERIGGFPDSQRTQVPDSWSRSRDDRIGFDSGFPKGYTANHHNKVFTVFSAPNYCYYVGNLGAFVEVDELGYLTL